VTEVSWSCEAAPKDRMMEGFKANVVAPWNAVAESDNDTLLNYWVVDEAKTCVKVYQRVTSSAAALAHFTTCVANEDCLIENGKICSSDGALITESQQLALCMPR